jgi:uncharacterized protein
MNDEVFSSLRERLELEEWPGLYFFKFIVPNNPEAINGTKELFSKWAEVKENQSKTGKFVSISAKQFMESVDAVIELYNRAQAISGIISL